MPQLPYSAVTNLQHTADPNMIKCTVKFDHLDEPVPHAPSKHDPDTVEIYERAMAGDFGPIAPYVPPELTPEEMRAAMPRISPRELQLTLLNHGVSPSQVLAAIMAMPEGIDRERAKIEWEKATYFQRTHDLIDTLGAVFGFTPEQIDAMWEEAQTI